MFQNWREKKNEGKYLCSITYCTFSLLRDNYIQMFFSFFLSMNGKISKRENKSHGLKNRLRSSLIAISKGKKKNYKKKDFEKLKDEKSKEELQNIYKLK